ncbi:MAG TPA: M23 family metallopeptidase [Candidatus Limnocylindrales bacterium]|nr:M23 family metallopeptidase [Candidatus Limnocylindrales bacterium]
MLNATVGAQRVLRRLRPTRGKAPIRAFHFRHRSASVARDLRNRAASLTSTTESGPDLVERASSIELPRRLTKRFGHEAILPIAVVLIVVVASVVSWLPGRASTTGPVGGPLGDGPGPRVALGGVAGAGGNDGEGPSGAGTQSGEIVSPESSQGGVPGRVDPDAATLGGRGELPAATTGRGQMTIDGTIVKPISVDTDVPDGRGLLKTYTVRTGDTLTGIANRFGLSVMTIWWANSLKSATDFAVGDDLMIPPLDGLVITAREGDTLESIGNTYDVAPDKIYDLNGLEDRTLVVGQTLVLPGAEGEAIATPTPRPTTRPVVATPRPVATGTSGTVRQPTTYSGGAMAWPVIGGSNFISQYFHSGHYAIDVAADYGSRVVATASGTVTFAGWKDNGGGYQVWISHGSNLYTTYNHMSSITVGRGQSVARGQQVGRIGQSGNATGPHLHFEVWRGPIWDGGTRVNPLIYL